MKSGFITPTDKFELKSHELVEFAHSYCSEYNFEDFQEFASQYNFVDPAYEYVLRVLKWIQVGTISEPIPSYLLSVPIFEGLNEMLEVHELVSDKYEDLKNRQGKFLSKITFLSKFVFSDITKKFSLQSGFVLQDGTLVSYKNCTHYLIAKALSNYFGASNELINNYFQGYDDTCFEDLFVRLLGFLKVGNYGTDKIVTFVPEITNLTQKKIVEEYDMLGFRVEELKPYDLESSRQIIKTLKF